MDEVHQQRREALDFDVGKRRKHFARHFNPLGRREKGVLRLAVGDPDNDGFKQARRPADQILVSASKRIESPGVDDFERWHGARWSGYNNTKVSADCNSLIPSAQRRHSPLASDDNAPARPSRAAT